nr:putative E3 ubiquitin-protein ligase RF298 [Tanacetum cinerariifolium]
SSLDPNFTNLESFTPVNVLSNTWPYNYDKKPRSLVSVQEGHPTMLEQVDVKVHEEHQKEGEFCTMVLYTHSAVVVVLDLVVVLVVVAPVIVVVAVVEIPAVKMASTTIMVQEKGSRNKRKFRADPPPVTELKLVSLSNECLGYELTAESFVTREHVNGCDMCCFGRESVDPVELDLGLLCLGDSLMEHHFEDLHQMEIVKVANGGGRGGWWWEWGDENEDEDVKNKQMFHINQGIKDKQTSSFNSYALYAYDSVWLLAYALDKFLKSGGSDFGLSALRTFIKGEKLLQTILATTFMGLTDEKPRGGENNGESGGKSGGKSGGESGGESCGESGGSGG